MPLLRSVELAEGALDIGVKFILFRHVEGGLSLLGGLADAEEIDFSLRQVIRGVCSQILSFDG